MTKLFLVTGSTGEIGMQLCRYLAEKGYGLIITSRSIDKLNKLSNELQDEFKIKVNTYASDFSNRLTFCEVVKACQNGIDGLVLMPPQPPEVTDCLPSPEVWENMYKTSFIGPVELIRQLISSLRKSGNSKVVVISGISSLQPMSKYATSNTLRTAWLGQVKTMADVYGPEGIGFNSISLGGVMTERFKNKVTNEAMQSGLNFSDALSKRFDNVPLRRYAEIREISDFIHFLLTSEASNHLTGNNIPFDGGYHRGY